MYKLPEKISVADPFDEEFLEKRRVGFEQFMKAACENEELKLSKVLMQFLCDDQLEKEPWYAKVNATSALDGIGSMFSGLGNEDESVPSNSSNNNTPNKMNSANTNTNNTNNNINSESPGVNKRRPRRRETKKIRTLPLYPATSKSSRKNSESPSTSPSKSF